MAVDLVSKVQEPLLARAVVKPINARQVIGRALLLPERQEKIFLGHLQLPAEVRGH